MSSSSIDKMIDNHKIARLFQIINISREVSKQFYCISSDSSSYLNFIINNFHF